MEEQLFLLNSQILDIKYLTLDLRPLYLCVIMIIWNAPPAKKETALKEVYDMFNEHENAYPDAILIILEDFYHCSPWKSIPTLYIFPTNAMQLKSAYTKKHKVKLQASPHRSHRVEHLLKTL